jgi:hypothetical protein
MLLKDKENAILPSQQQQSKLNFDSTFILLNYSNKNKHASITAEGYFNNCA